MAFQVPIRRGEEHPFSKLTNEERRDCHRRFRNGERVTDLAREKGISQPRMSKIVHNPDPYRK